MLEGVNKVLFADLANQLLSDVSTIEWRFEDFGVADDGVKLGLRSVLEFVYIL